jgi:hypothetical protein
MCASQNGLVPACKLRLPLLATANKEFGGIDGVDSAPAPSHFDHA